MIGFPCLAGTVQLIGDRLGGERSNWGVIDPVSLSRRGTAPLWEWVTDDIIGRTCDYFHVVWQAWMDVGVVVGSVASGICHTVNVGGI